MRKGSILRYAISETSNLSRRALRRQFGFEDTAKRKEEKAEIRESVYRLASIKEKAVLLSLGVQLSE